MDVEEAVVDLVVIWKSIVYLLFMDVYESVVYLFAVDVLESVSDMEKRLTTNWASDWPYIRSIPTLPPFIRLSHSK